MISLVLPSNPNEEKAIVPQNIPLDIVYEDDDVMVINKKPGMVVHPGIGNPDNTLVNALVYYFENKEGLPVLQGNSENRAGLVHRIDKDTSGLMLIAKTDFAMTALAKQFYDHTIDREYVAVVWSSPDEPKGTIEGDIARHPKNRLQMYVDDEYGTGKHAVTHYEVLEDLYYISLVKCKLETGRTHQIRVHMKYIGCTLFNDARYGGDKVLKGTVFSKYKQFVMNCFDVCPRQALHAKTLGFTHPPTGERLSFDSELPEDITAMINKWKDYFNTRKDYN
jgi:23S rRNA pseudouridine1911/1915/1917 synthase